MKRVSWAGWAVGVLAFSGCAMGQGSIETALPPSDADREAWVDYYRVPRQVWGNRAAGPQCRGLDSELQRVVVDRDTVLDLARIDARFVGSIAFDWEPLRMDPLPKEEWNVIGVQAFTMEDANGIDVRTSLEDILLEEAWTFEGGDARDAKTIEFADFNFDGFPDMRMTSGGNATAQVYFTYNPKTRLYETNPDMHYLTVDGWECERKLIYNSGGGSSWYWTFATLRIAESGQFEVALVEEWEVMASPKGGRTGNRVRCAFYRRSEGELIKLFAREEKL
jgi:hypothetical protein